MKGDPRIKHQAIRFDRQAEEETETTKDQKEDRVPDEAQQEKTIRGDNTTVQARRSRPTEHRRFSKFRAYESKCANTKSNSGSSRSRQIKENI